MYLYTASLPDPLLRDLTTTLQPVIARYGFQSAASFMSEIEETQAVCCAMLPSLVRLLPGPYGWFRIVGLRPSQQIVAHRDPPRPGKRYHIPIHTNPGCWTLHAACWQQLVEGGVYEMDPTEIHGAVNWGETLRVHLLIDIDTPV